MVLHSQCLHCPALLSPKSSSAAWRTIGTVWSSSVQSTCSTARFFASCSPSFSDLQTSRQGKYLREQPAPKPLHIILSGAVLLTRFHRHVIDVPVLEVLLQHQGAPALRCVQLPRPVHRQYSREVVGVPGIGIRKNTDTLMAPILPTGKLK